jgi:AcrR family transcriptional regulator
MAEPQDRRALILSRAAELFARKSIATTTVREIADAVGVLSGSLYHHFESKDAIAAEILTSYLDLINTRYADVLSGETTPAQSLHDLVLVSLQIAEEQPHATAIYQNELNHLRAEPGLADVQKAAGRVQRTWLRVIEAGVGDGSFRADVPARVFYRLIRDAVWLSVRWHRTNGKYSTRQLAEDVTSVFLRGYATAE